jgi:AcrR family transcriptional regulator
MACKRADATKRILFTLMDGPSVRDATEARREHKKRTTRLALRAAALDLVSDRGYGRVTVEDMAIAAGVSVRTFFNYFESKEAALVGDDPEQIAAMTEQLLALPAEIPPLEALHTVLVDRLSRISEDIDLSGEDHEIWRRRMAVINSQPEVMVAYAKNLMKLEHALTDALVSRLGGGEHYRMYAAVMTASTLGAVRVAGSIWGGLAGDSSLVEVSTAALDLLARGLCEEEP